MARITGRMLNKKWGVGALHALYREDGLWYHCLEKFPGALFDRNGYILFRTEQEYNKCHYLSENKETNTLKVNDGISKIPGYKICYVSEPERIL